MKLLRKFFALAFIASFFVSCGKDDPAPAPVDYTLKDISVLAASYMGDCLIVPTSVNGDTIISPTTVRLVRTQTTNTMAIETTECGFIQGDILSNFKNTPDGLAYTFDIKGFSFERTNSPYISSWYSNQYSEISNVKVTIPKSSAQEQIVAKYEKSSKKLTFSYSASASFDTKTQSGVTGKGNVDFKYIYTVIKQ